MKGMGRLLLRVLTGFLALVLALSLASFHPSDPHFFATATEGMAATPRNLCGLFGSYLAGMMQTLVGVGAWMLPSYVFWEVFPRENRTWGRRAAWVALSLSFWAFLGAMGNRTFTEGVNTESWRWGGGVGWMLWSKGRHVLGPVGLPLLLTLVIGFCIFLLAPKVSKSVSIWLGKKTLATLPFLKKMPLSGLAGLKSACAALQQKAAWMRPFLTWRRGRMHHAPELDSQDFESLKHLEKQRRMEEESQAAFERAEREAMDYKRRKGAEMDLPVIQSMHLDAIAPLNAREADEYPEIRSMHLDGAMDLQGLNLNRVPVEENRPKAILLQNLPEPEPEPPLLVESLQMQDRYGRIITQPCLGLTEPDEEPEDKLPVQVAPVARGEGQKGMAPVGSLSDARPSGAFTSRGDSRRLPPPPPLGHSQSVPSQAVSSMSVPSMALAPADRLELPPRRLFDPPGPGTKLDPERLQEIQLLIDQKLSEFRVKGRVVGMQPGPVVTVYEFQPDPGVSLAKVMSMEDDLALGLQAEKVRIDRIPGRNLVGIEVPNPKREVIAFREVVDSPAFRDPSHKEAQSLLALALGKDIAGRPVVFDLAKMPHLLIGGSTGSGKSVGVNAMICSVLLRSLPSEVKLILVDPKMVEMGVYEDIPHLWAPVVTDMKEAGRVLKWVVAQMEDRYKRLALLSVRNLEGFNAKVQEAGGSIDLSDRTPNPRWPDRPSYLEPLPYVVVVIDELADLMMICRSEVEESIARIAQKARAVGIHLVLATQRPSVDIVTGVIKANLPARLSYRVNTKIDSRTILDTGGGEQLLGKGDALFLAPGQARPQRIHAPLITEEETLRLVEWLKARGKPEYNQGLLSAMETDEDAGGEDAMDATGGNSGDDIYDRALAIVKRERKASTSLLQRKLNIGYGRAARIIDRMEDEGVVGPDRGAGKPREVYVMEDSAV